MQDEIPVLSIIVRFFFRHILRVHPPTFGKRSPVDKTTVFIISFAKHQVFLPSLQSRLRKSYQLPQSSSSHYQRIIMHLSTLSALLAFATTISANQCYNHTQATLTQNCVHKAELAKFAESYCHDHYGKIHGDWVDFTDRSGMTASIGKVSKFGNKNACIVAFTRIVEDCHGVWDGGQWVDEGTLLSIEFCGWGSGDKRIGFEGLRDQSDAKRVRWGGLGAPSDTKRVRYEGLPPSTDAKRVRYERLPPPSDARRVRYEGLPPPSDARRIRYEGLPPPADAKRVGFGGLKIEM